MKLGMNLEVLYGPPGTGKTTEIGRRIKAYLDAGMRSSDIIVASLTRTAAKEAARVVDLPDKQVGTWHSFAYHALGRPALAEAHIKEWNELHPPMWHLSAAVGQGRGSGETADFDPQGWKEGDTLMLRYSQMRARCHPVEKTPFNLSVFALAWEDWKKQCGYMDFTDIIHEATLSVKTAPDDPKIIFCDECQDLSLLEAGLVAAWGRHASKVIMAGDFHQSIFGWRGSDPLAVQTKLRFEAQSLTQTILSQSYRIPHAVHRLAMTQMARCTPLEMVAYKARDAPGFAERRAFSFSEPEQLVHDMRKHYFEGRSIMFLATCGYMLDKIIIQLLHQGIPWHNPWRVSNGRWNPLSASRGVSFYDRCKAFMAPDDDIFGDDARLWTLSDLKAWAAALPAKGVFKPGAKTAIANLKGGSLDELEIMQRAGEWFTEEALESIRNLDIKWFLVNASSKTVGAQLVRQMVARKATATLGAKPRVIVGTVHSLKGSEADVVYVCPDVSVAAAQAADEDRKLKEEIERIFYVALTRAREGVVLCEPSSHLYVGL